jgi:transcriptional regulator with XRE-family HTH domain
VNDDLAVLIGGRVRTRRKAAALTQLQAAERLDMTGEAYARIERGQAIPSCPTLMRICALYGVTPDALLLAEPPGSATTSDQVADRMRRLWAAMSALDTDRLDLVERLIGHLASR